MRRSCRLLGWALAVGLRVRSAGADLGANDFARHNDFHPAVLLPSFRGGVVRDGHGFPEPYGGNSALGKSLLDEIRPDTLSALLGKLLVEFIRPHAVGMPFHL